MLFISVIITIIKCFNIHETHLYHSYSSRLLERFNKIISRKRITIIIILNDYIIEQRDMMQILNNRINIKFIYKLVAINNIILYIILNNSIINHFIFSFHRNRYLHNTTPHNTTRPNHAVSPRTLPRTTPHRTSQHNTACRVHHAA
nr:MAG TPA: hypothetical protein [Bacteriophage sp.]